MHGLAPSETTITEAGQWLARLRADDRTPEDESAFRAWLIADPRNAVAFDALNSIWEDLGALSRELRYRENRTEQRLSRRAILASGAGAVLAFSGTFAFLRTAEAEVYQTDVGEQKHISLRDGSDVFLDTNTKLVVNFTDKNRIAELRYGRANFTIASDSERPFAVDVAQSVVVGNQSNFDVRRDGEDVSVLLIQGDATISNEAASKSQSHLLHAGQRLVVEGDLAAKLDKPDLAPLLAWHTCQAVFENSILASAVREMNRYSTMKLEMADPRIADMKVSGVYRLGDNRSFAVALSHVLPISFSTEDNRIQLVIDETRLVQG